MDFWHPPDFEERMRKLRLGAPASLVAGYFRLFVDQRAYTVRSDRPRSESTWHYCYRPWSKKTGLGISLAMDTIWHHIERAITVALYTINPATRGRMRMAIDADSVMSAGAFIPIAQLTN